MDFWQQLTGHLAANSGPYLAAAIFIGAFALMMGSTLLVRTNSVLRPLTRIRSAGDDPSMIIPAVLRTVEGTEEKVSLLEETCNRHLRESRLFMRHVGLVKYDAFDDVAGRQSFSLCLLDANKSGVLITNLTGKNFTRSYAVTLKDGEASRELSEDESRAVDEALSREVVGQV